MLKRAEKRASKFDVRPSQHRQAMELDDGRLAEPQLRAPAAKRLHRNVLAAAIQRARSTKAATSSSAWTRCSPSSASTSLGNSGVCSPAPTSSKTRGAVRQVGRNVKRWRNAEMALRWTAARMIEAQKTFRHLKAYRQLPSAATPCKTTCARLNPTVPLKPS